MTLKKATFNIEVEEKIYSVTPGDHKTGIYLIMAENTAIAWIQRGRDYRWIEMDPFSKLPLGGLFDEHINAMGLEIEKYYGYNDH